MSFEQQWHQPVTVQFTLGDLMILHASLTDTIATLWVPELREPAHEACHTLLQNVTEPITSELCERLLQTIVAAAPELLPEPEGV